MNEDGLCKNASAVRTLDRRRIAGAGYPRGAQLGNCPLTAMARRRTRNASGCDSPKRPSRRVGRRRKGTAAREQLLEWLLAHSYRHASSDKFALSSGRRSNVYIDCKATTMRAEAAPLVAQACSPFIPPEAEAVGGLTLGADAIAAAISFYVSQTTHRKLHYFTVRKAPKRHGLMKYIEGCPGSRVVVVDDVVTTGGSTIEAIRRCRDARIRVVAVIALVDREESGGMEAVRAAAGPDVPVSALFKKSELEARWRLRKRGRARVPSARRHAVAM
ncbi:MAG: orotate phosphoribosyltransferase [Candidatus Binatia bacterium]